MRTFIFLILALALGACNFVAHSPQPENPAATGDTASASIIHNMSAQAFRAKMQELPNEQLVDVRTAEEVAQGQIPGAINLDVTGNDFAEKLNTLDKTQPVMVYCASGNRSKRACNVLKDWGFREVYELGAGYKGWKKAGFEELK